MECLNQTDVCNSMMTTFGVKPFQTLNSTRKQDNVLGKLWLRVFVAKSNFRGLPDTTLQCQLVIAKYGNNTAIPWTYVARNGKIQVPRYIQSAYGKLCGGVSTTSPFYPAPNAPNQPILLTPSYSNISTASVNINSISAPLTTDKWYAKNTFNGPILRIGTNTAISASVDSSVSLLFDANN